ncbi:MAG TPA: hypothetical protein VHF69_00600 [Candidatus Synoicihabitans sp.]|nr:hypothetical protein [Candidatus Synoicihabitans sp.]
MPQDYILRLLQQLGAIVATILGKRAAGDLDGAEAEIAEQCLRHTGLPLVVVKQSTPEALAQLLAMGGAMQTSRALILAELLRHDAQLAEARGNPVAAALSYQQADRLIADSLPSLAGEEAEAFRQKQAEIATKLRDLGGDR